MAQALAYQRCWHCCHHHSVWQRRIVLHRLPACDCHTAMDARATNSPGSAPDHPPPLRISSRRVLRREEQATGRHTVRSRLQLHHYIF
jgi:hypothetical protein